MSPKNSAKVVRLGIDIAKDVFQLHGVDARGKTVLKQQVSRRKLLQSTVNMQPCLIGMEACGGAHFLAMEMQKQGHEVRLMAGHLVKPFVTSANKDDSIDAAAITEAVGRPNMRFVPVKSAEQLDIQSLHRDRQLAMKHMTAWSNHIRGALVENGIIIAKSPKNLRQRLPLILEDADNGLSMMCRTSLSRAYEMFKSHQSLVAEIDAQIQKVCRGNEVCTRLATVDGFGPLTATAFYAAVGNGRQFKNGRGAAAWLGVIPRHRGSGGKTHVTSLSKRGNRYLKTLVIHGGRSIAAAAMKKKCKDNPFTQKIVSMIERKGFAKAAVAIGHQNVRIAWALVARGQEYKRAA